MAVLFTGLIMSSVLDLSAHAAVIGSIIGDKIAVTGDGEEIIGLDIVSRGDYLIPIPVLPGESDPSPEPFMFFLKNEPDEVILGTFGTPLMLDGELVTAIGYAAPLGTDITADLIQSTYGEPGALEPTSLFFVPEPATALLAFIGVLGLLGFRQHRKSHVG
jgi:hypothetical protein